MIFTSVCAGTVEEETCFFSGDKRRHHLGTKWHPYVPYFGFMTCALCTCGVRICVDETDWIANMAKCFRAQKTQEPTLLQLDVEGILTCNTDHTILFYNGFEMFDFSFFFFFVVDFEQLKSNWNNIRKNLYTTVIKPYISNWKPTFLKRWKYVFVTVVVLPGFFIFICFFFLVSWFFSIYTISWAFAKESGVFGS